MHLRDCTALMPSDKVTTANETRILCGMLTLDVTPYLPGGCQIGERLDDQHFGVPLATRLHVKLYGDQDRFDFAGIAKMPEPTCDLAGVRRVADIRL